MWRFIIVLAVVFMILPSLYGQSVIVNEMSQGSDGGKEWVELLVVDEGVDLRGWELGDNDDGIWHSIAEFTSHTAWESLLSGTIIVIYNGGDVDATITLAGGEDTDFSDKSVIISVSNATYLTDTGPWGSTSGAFANTDRDDCAALRDANDIMIHDMAVTHGTATISSPGSAEVKYYTGNTASGTSDVAKWTEASSTAGTPGSSNGGDNADWVDISLPVELSKWYARSSMGQIILNWTTESEFENQGFIINRRQNSESSSQELSSFVSNESLLGCGSSTARNHYSYLDKQVEIGQTYIYQLFDVDYQGKVTKHNEISVTVIGAEQDLKPVGMLLHPAHPNPFNPVVHLAFSLDQESDMLSMDIRDLQGALVQRIVEGHTAAGIHEFSWNGENAHGNQLSSGVYVVRLASAGSVRTQTITLLR